MKKILAAVLTVILLFSAAAAESTVVNRDDFKEQAEQISGTTYKIYDFFSYWIPDTFTGPDEKSSFKRADGSSDVESISVAVGDPSLFDRFPSWGDYEEFTVNGNPARAILFTEGSSKTWFGCICFEDIGLYLLIIYSYEPSADDEEARQFFLMLMSFAESIPY